MLYQRDASFIARLDNPPNVSYDDTSFSGAGSRSSESSSAELLSNDIDDATNDDGGGDDDELNDTITKPNDDHFAGQPAAATAASMVAKTYTTTTTTTAATYVPPAGNYYALSMEDMSVYDDVNNNRLNLPSPQQMYFKSTEVGGRTSTAQPTAALAPSVASTSVSAASELETSSVTSFGADSTSHSYIRIDVYDNNADAVDGADGDKTVSAMTATATRAPHPAETITEGGSKTLPLDHPTSTTTAATETAK